MKNISATCPLTLARIVDEYFPESRNKLIELAAFFDRLDRAADSAKPDKEFRVAALKQAAAILLESGPQRVKRITLLLSDPTDEPREHLDRKAALGAYLAPEETI
jgi:hypothetical protein